MDSEIQRKKMIIEGRTQNEEEYLNKMEDENIKLDFMR